MGHFVDLLRSALPLVGRALARGQLFRPSCTLTKPHEDVLCDFDVRIPIADGVHLGAHVFRSKAAAARNQPMPVVMCAQPYDNRKIAALGGTPFRGAPMQY